jgi:hypothetical protein
MTRLRAQFDGKVLIPTEPVDLPRDRIFEIEVRDEEPPIGSAAAILQIMRSPPYLSREDAEALEHAMEEGKVPARQSGIFDTEE